MQTKIDYIGFTAPCRMPFEPEDLDNQRNALLVLNDFLGDEWVPITFGHTWEVYKAKGFYHTRIFDAETKVSVSFGNVNRHIHVEFGGQALDHIRAIGFYEQFIQRVATRTSRVDFAVDFENEVTVSDFIVNRQKGRFKAGGNIFSEDGETSYVGSWKAERFARVYRYHDPHPRSKMLRAEVVLRGTYAKQAMSIVLTDGEVQATLAAHEPFGWEHKCWQPTEAVTSKIVSKRHDKEGASTVRWLNGDVAACIVRLHGETLIDAFEWFDLYVAPYLPRKRDIIDDLCP
jgi:DNA relaxase NicK